MSIKVAIVLLVVIVVLFVAAVVVGGNQRAGDPDDRPGLVDRLGDVGAVALADVSAGCFDDDDTTLLAVTGTCVVTVTSDAETARLGLQALVGSVTVSAPAPRGNVERDGHGRRRRRRPRRPRGRRGGRRRRDEHHLGMSPLRDVPRAGARRVSSLRTPFLILALVVAILVVLLELGNGLIIGGADVSSDLVAEAEEMERRPSIDDPASIEVEEPPGRAIAYLALVDGIVLYTVLLIVASLVIPERIHGRLQGVVTLVLSIFLIIGAFILAIIAFVELLVMVSLLLATPFGTIAYLAIWGFFPRSDAAALLALLMFLKLGFSALLVLAHQRFLQQKGLIALVLTSLVCNVLVAFLHGVVPRIIVSITDSIAAIIIAVVAIVWGIILLIGAIPSVVSSIVSAVRSAAPST